MYVKLTDYMSVDTSKITSVTHTEQGGEEVLVIHLPDELQMKMEVHDEQHAKRIHDTIVDLQNNPSSYDVLASGDETVTSSTQEAT